jgi:chromosome segregation ATPase
MADEPTIDTLQAEITSLKGKLTDANNESKGHRLNADKYRQQAEDWRNQFNAAQTDANAAKQAHAEELERTKIDLTARATDAETKANEAGTKARDKVMMADLRVAAREAGMLDLDGLKLLDREGAKLDDDGNVTNASDLMEAMRESKPYLFGKAPVPGTQTGTTASTAQPPQRATPTAFDARKAGRDEVGRNEVQAAERAYLSSVGR